MKANEFVKKFGLDKAKSIVFDPLHPQMTHVSNDGRHWINDKFSCIPEIQEQISSMIPLADLKRLVESHELVEVKGGLKTAKFLVQRADKLTYQLEQKGFGMNGVPNKAIDELRQAIADVESCQ